MADVVQLKVPRNVMISNAIDALKEVTEARAMLLLVINKEGDITIIGGPTEDQVYATMFKAGALVGSAFLETVGED